MMAHSYYGIIYVYRGNAPHYGSYLCECSTHNIYVINIRFDEESTHSRFHERMLRYVVDDHEEYISYATWEDTRRSIGHLE